MLFTKKNSMLKSWRHPPLVETESTSKLQICAVSYNIQYGGINAFINKRVVFFYFQNVAIQFPRLAFDQLMQEIPGMNDLSANLIKSDETTSVKLTKFKFSDQFGKESVTLSK